MSFILSDGGKVSAIIKFSIKNTRMYDIRCPPWYSTTGHYINIFFNLALWTTNYKKSLSDSIF